METHSAETGSPAPNRMKLEMALQKRLACQLYKTSEGNNALFLWTEDQERGPAAQFRKYLSTHPETNLEAVSPDELDAILVAAGIEKPPVH